MKRLPRGVWVRITNLSAQTTERDLQLLLQNRTGIQLPMECISRDHMGAFISLTDQAVSGLLHWALSEDTLHGQPIRVVIPALNRSERPVNGASSALPQRVSPEEANTPEKALVTADVVRETRLRGT